MSHRLTDGGPAFPVSTQAAVDAHTGSPYGHQDSASTWQFPGMTRRDYFAAHAPDPPDSWRGGDRRLSDVIEWRWYYADAMLKAGATPPNK